MGNGEGIGERVSEAAMTAVGLVPGVGAAAETVRQEAHRGTNPVAITLEATFDGFLNLALPGVEKALKNIEASQRNDRRGGREREEIPFGGFAFMAAADTAFTLAKIGVTAGVANTVGPEAAGLTFVALHEMQERLGLAVTSALMQKVMERGQA